MVTNLLRTLWEPTNVRLLPRLRIALRGHDAARDADRTTFETLHTASSMSAVLRQGLSRESAEGSARQLSSLLGGRAVAITGGSELLAWEGPKSPHAADCVALAAKAAERGAITVVDHSDFDCHRPRCELRKAVVAPLVVDDAVVGALQAFGGSASAGLVRATSELAAWVAGQVELAEVDSSRTRLMEAEVRALRAQISPHFIYNALNAIASFVRTDPDRARSLLVDFADFTRYSFRKHGEFTTLDDELRSIERYLALEQARFGERLQVKLLIAPEVLPVAVPVFSLQPLVENAVRHGLADKPGVGHITILASDAGAEAAISVEDDGRGEDPERIRRLLHGEERSDSIGLGNVDERLRATFGDDYGLVVETAPGAGTKVMFRVPKFAAGVSA